MFVLLACPRWRWCLGNYLRSIQHEILYETSKNSPGHQRHLGEAYKTNI